MVTGISKPSAGQRALFEQATKRGYLLTDRKDARLMNAWWARCTEERKPYVKV